MCFYLEPFHRWLFRYIETNKMWIRLYKIIKSQYTEKLGCCQDVVFTRFFKHLNKKNIATGSAFVPSQEALCYCLTSKVPQNVTLHVCLKRLKQFTYNETTTTIMVLQIIYHLKRPFNFCISRLWIFCNGNFTVQAILYSLMGCHKKYWKTLRTIVS